MKIYQLFHNLVQKFVPMDSVSETNLQLEAVKFYQDILDDKNHIERSNIENAKYNTENFEEVNFSVRPLQKIKLKHTIVAFLDQWYMRYIFALLFIYFVPVIKAYINGEESEGDEDGEADEDTNDFTQFMEFKRFKKSLL